MTEIVSLYETFVLLDKTCLFEGDKILSKRLREVLLCLIKGFSFLPGSKENFLCGLPGHGFCWAVQSKATPQQSCEESFD